MVGRGGSAELKVELERLASERRWAEVRDRLSHLDDVALAADPKLAYLLAEALAHVGDMDRALTLALAAESEFRSRHDTANLINALNLAGAVQFELGDLDGAEERFSTLLELARERRDDGMIGRATNNLGAIASLRGEHERALSLYRLSIPAYQKVGQVAGLAQTSHNLGIVYRDLGQWGESEQHYARAVTRARQLGDERLEMMACVGRAEILHRRGDQVYARTEASRALETFARIGDELGRADALRLLAAVAAASGQSDDAKTLYGDALRLARQHGNPLLEAEILEGRAEMHERAGVSALALADREVATALYKKLGAVERARRVETRIDSEND